MHALSHPIYAHFQLPMLNGILTMLYELYSVAVVPVILHIFSICYYSNKCME